MQRRYLATGNSRYGPTGQATPGVLPHGQHRVHDAVGTDPDLIEDWETFSFASSRVDRARYSPSRQELQVFWVNAPQGVPYVPYAYDAVDQVTWSNFCGAGSPGRFVNTNLNNFPLRRAPEVMGEF
jgi:hypothetical protein